MLLQITCQYFHGGRFSCTIRAKKSNNLSLIYTKRNIVYCFLLAVYLNQVFYFYSHSTKIMSIMERVMVLSLWFMVCGVMKREVFSTVFVCNYFLYSPFHAYQPKITSPIAIGIATTTNT